MLLRVREEEVRVWWWTVDGGKIKGASGEGGGREMKEASFILRCSIYQPSLRVHATTGILEDTQRGLAGDLERKGLG